MKVVDYKSLSLKDVGKASYFMAKCLRTIKGVNIYIIWMNAEY